MISFKKVCEELKNALLAEKLPSYKFDAEAICNNDFLLEQVEKSNRSFTSSFNFEGCCEIGNLTGNQIIIVFLDILKKQRFQTGKQICLDVDGHSMAMLTFSNVSLRVCAPRNPDKLGDNSQHRSLYSKLFNDKDVKSLQGPNPEGFLKQEHIDKNRKEAKDLFPKFLSSRFVEITPLEYRNCFLGLVAKCAFRMSSIDPVREVNDEVEKVPFLACIEIAFRSGKTGMISDLLGELNRSGHDKQTHLEKVASTIIETSNVLINEAFQIDRENNKLAYNEVKRRRKRKQKYRELGKARGSQHTESDQYDEEATERIAECIRSVYNIARSSNAHETIE